MDLIQEWLRQRALQPGEDRMPDSAAFKREESALILLSLVVLGLLFLVHAFLFLGGGGPAGFMLQALALRFLMQLGEFAYLQVEPRPLRPQDVSVHAHASVWMHLLFAWLLTFSGDLEQRHAVVLFLLPITAAAFRFSLAGTIGVALAAGGQAFFEVWWMHRDETAMWLTVAYFEAATITLAFVVAALVVWFLGEQLRTRERALKENLARLQRTQEELVEREKLAAVGRLASALAHEVRNPVAMISSSFHLATDTQDCERQREMLGIAQQELRRLEHLTTGFLSFARVPEPKLANGSAREAIEYVAALARPESERAGLRLYVHCDERAHVHADPFQLQQILLNLVRNAIQAAHPDTAIRIEGIRDREVVCLSVENCGDAIPAEAVGQLFEPFFTTKPSGSGLGLAISRRLAEGMGGDLRLRLNKPGAVRFELILPPAQLPPESPAP